MSEKTSLQENEISNLKFTPDGEIKPFYGLTCITWMDEKSELYSILMGTQRSIQAKFKTAGVDQNFFFLEPASFHMTICDITASSTPIVRAEIETVCNQIQDVFSDGLQVESIQAQVRGLGLTSTITALVRFQQESELEKALLLENQIKNATQTDVRNFLGHITLAYCVKSPQTDIKKIREILEPYQSQDFGEFTFSEFDLTYFTDMNTFLPLSSVSFTDGYVKNHFENLGKTIISEVSPS